MEFNSETYARMLEVAVQVKDEMLDRMQEIIGHDVTEEEAIAYFTATSLLCKLSAQVTRALSGRTPDEIKKVMKEDCASLKILLETMKPEFLKVMTQELKSKDIPKFLEEMEFFEFRDSEIHMWDLELQPVPKSMHS